jgi:adenine deaminase
MWCAVNRITASGEVAGPEQRVSAELALRGVTIDAAHSLKLENEIGSLVPGKRANFTILAENPLAMDAMRIRDVKVWGTVMEGRKLPVVYSEKNGQKKSSLDPNYDGNQKEFAHAALNHAVKVATCTSSAGGGWPRVPRRS